MIKCAEKGPDTGNITRTILVLAVSLSLLWGIAAAAERPGVEITPPWLEDAAAYQLPAWYDGIRVCAHTRLPFRNKYAVFSNAGEAFQTLGFREMSRHIKGGGEGAWWPAAEGPVEEWARDRNWAKEIIDEAHRHGQRIIVYYRHSEDAGMAALHPDWVCLDEKGRPAQLSRGAGMCLNSPYRQYLIGRLLELTAMGADGFYFDHCHMPPEGCWCANCRKQFTELTGLQHPAKADVHDPVWLKLADFNSLTIEQAFLDIRQAVHARNPECMLVIGSNVYPQMTGRHLSQRLCRIADAVKTEFHLPLRGEFGARRAIGTLPDPDGFAAVRKPDPDVRVALGWSLARDAADGRPPHVWTHGLPNEQHAVYATAAMIAHGCVANLHYDEKEIADPARFRTAVELGNRVSPAFAGLRPMHWALVHYAEAARDADITSAVALWRNNLWPMLGAYKALLRDHLPVAVITDSQLEQGMFDGCRLLFLPRPELLTEHMRASIARFKTAGGVVIENTPEWHWHDPGAGHAQALDGFRQQIAAAAVTAPVQVTGGPEIMQSAVFTNRDGTRVTVAIVNDYRWVFTGQRMLRDRRTRKELGPNPEYDQKAALPAPPPCTGVTVLLRGLEAPKRITEMASGRELTCERKDGAWEIAVPTFGPMAVVAMEW